MYLDYKHGSFFPYSIQNRQFKISPIAFYSKSVLRSSSWVKMNIKGLVKIADGQVKTSFRLDKSQPYLLVNYNQNYL